MATALTGNGLWPMANGGREGTKTLLSPRDPENRRSKRAIRDIRDKPMFSRVSCNSQSATKICHGWKSGFGAMFSRVVTDVTDEKKMPKNLR